MINVFVEDEFSRVDCFFFCTLFFFILNCRAKKKSGMLAMDDEGQLPVLAVNFTDYENFTEDQYLERILGPKHLPLKLVLPVTVIYALIFVTGVFGNAVTCLVIVRNPAMQTATNHYLFSLAVSDLLLLILGLPNELWVFWQQYPWELGLIACKGRAFVSEMSSYVSVLTIVAFSLERYLAICHPLRLYVMSGLKRHIFIILAAWIIASVCAVPFFSYTDVNYVEWPPGSRNASKNSAVCAMLNMPGFPLYEMSCLIFFLGPMVIIMWLYVHMGLTIQSTTLGHRIDGTIHGETRPSQSRKAIIRMLSAVVMSFFICWAPFHAQRLLYVYGKRYSFDYGAINEWLYPLGGSLYYFSTTINPILYNVMSAKYRNAFKETLCCSPPAHLHHNTEADLSSMREMGICRCNSLRNSQIVRVRSLYYNNRSVKCHLENARDPLHLSLADDENENHRHSHNHCERGGDATSLRVPTCGYDETATSYETKKCSMVIQSRNGRAKCRASDEAENEISAGETRI